MTRARRWAKRAGAAGAGLLAACLLTAGAIYGIVQYDGNVHVVDPGVVLRSAQPTGARLDEIVHRYAVRSVLNLRGDNAGKAWYEEEMRASRADGLAHFDYAISAEHDVTPAQMDELLRIVATAPKPLLIHCNAGADRTGLVSALYQVSRGVPPRRQRLSCRSTMDTSHTSGARPARWIAASRPTSRSEQPPHPEMICCKTLPALPAPWRRPLHVPRES